MDNYYITSEISKLLQLFVSGKIQQKNETVLYKIQQLDSCIDKSELALRRKLVEVYNHYLYNCARGDERILVSTAIVDNLKSITNLDKTDYPSIAELTRILIEEKSVRDIELAMSHSEFLDKSNQKPKWLIPSINKAKRWQGDIDIPKNTNFSGLTITPASLREERTKLRKLIISLSKENNPQVSVAAKRLYNLALYVTYLYGDHDCNSAVSGPAYTHAEKTYKKVSSKFNYDYLGRIENSSFLSEQDYKRIEKHLGKKTSIINIRDLT